MEYKDRLTTEAVKIKKLPLSQFDLVNYAINIARHKIEAGIGLESQNIAAEILGEIAVGKDLLDALFIEKIEAKEAMAFESMPAVEDISAAKKNRARKQLVE